MGVRSLIEDGALTMGTDTLAVATARQNVRTNAPSSPTIVRELLDTIDRLERQIELMEDD